MHFIRRKWSAVMAVLGENGFAPEVKDTKTIAGPQHERESS
ncbi:hypothetical protein FRUB_00782 [Fimbriiglobus ruber]|uniref:Uncharacterized protein n=1 Tax=Fimbriiglobus ruber TaxID=1908690 RepID=A0A225E1K0_9BACT|nr:hypothetical protein FRUB_00782 [Fimbriiglobus ruber]